MVRLIPKARPGQPIGTLPDPLQDRVVSHVPPPRGQLMGASHYWKQPNVPDVDALIAHFAAEGALEQELVLEIFERIAALYAEEPNLLELHDPITVVGDIHGQYFDLAKVIELLGGDPRERQYLFLGDYGDRGAWGLECVLLLATYKILYPDKIKMLRGNHETRQMTCHYNFKEEVLYKYDMTVYDALMRAFDQLPVACVINGRYLALHGGISPNVRNLKASFSTIDRFGEPKMEGIVCDCIWADPLPDNKEGRGKDRSTFTPNKNRGCSFFYSAEGARQFLQRNDLICIFRAHEVQQAGHLFHGPNPALDGFPTTITVFSAPNYTETYGNNGAILKLDNGTLNVVQYNWVMHPCYLPNFQNVLGWGLPFLVDKVLEMLRAILSVGGELGESDLVVLPEGVLQKFRELQETGCGSEGGDCSIEAKLRAIAGSLSNVKEVVKEREAVMENGLCSLPGVDATELAAVQDSADDKFGSIKNLDLHNEMMPSAKV